MLLVRELVDKCDQFFKRHLTMENCLQLYVRSRTLTTTYKDQIRSFVLTNLKKITTQQLEEIDATSLGELLACDSLPLTEKEVFSIVKVYCLKEENQKYAKELVKRGFSAEIFHNQIFCFGGCEGGAVITDSCERYDTELNIWMFIQAMTTARCNTASIVYEHCIYIFEGLSSKGKGLRSCEKYDACSQRWSCIAAMKETRSGASSTLYNGSILVAGGNCGCNIEIYSIDENSWSYFSCLTVPHSHFSFCVLDGKLLALGGGNTCEEFDKDSGSWSVIDFLDSQLERSSFCVIKGSKNLETWLHEDRSDIIKVNMVTMKRLYEEGTYQDIRSLLGIFKP